MTAPPPRLEAILRQLAQRWGDTADDVAVEETIVRMVAHDQLNERDAARWLSRVVTNPQFASLLRDYAADGWNADRFREIYRLYRGSLDKSFELEAPDGDSRPAEAIEAAKLLTQRWKDSGDRLAHEKAIVQLVARGRLSEAEAARWVSGIVSEPLLASLLALYASDDWDATRFGQAFDSYHALVAERRPRNTQGGRRSEAPSKYVVINSFPKSGNTWIRQFISCLCFDGSLAAIPDHYRGEIDRAPIYTTPDGVPLRFYKSHDRLPPVMAGRTLIEHHAAIHIRRHPLDVFISHLNFLHLAKIREQSGSALFATEFDGIDDIVDHDLIWAYFGVFLTFGTLNPKFQSAGSWFDNVTEWRDPAGDFPLFALRYEDLVDDGVAELTAIGAMLGKTSDEVATAFAEAQRLTARDGQFFWRQVVGTHTKYLTAAQIAAFYDIHGEKIRAAGY